MNALIIYRDFASAARANSILLSSASQPGMGVRWNVRPWRVELLKFSPTANKALSEALDTHIIIFAGNWEQAFPFWLQDWLEVWAQHRQIADPVLAVIRATRAGIAPVSTTPDLARFAARHDLQVIYDDLPASADSASLPRNTLLPIVPNLSLNLEAGVSLPEMGSNNNLRPQR